MQSLTVPETLSLRRVLTGCLLGTAVGDSLGLPAEGMSRSRQRRLFGEITEHRFLWGRGMVSDDTEHTILTAQALLRSADDSDLFARALAAGLRGWILLLPAGVGFATLRACLKLLVGVPPTHSGVYSAGNGPAMRAAILGVRFGDDLDLLRQMVAVSARLTHTDPKAEYGALAVALAAHQAAIGRNGGEEYLARLCALLPKDEAADEMRRLAQRAVESAGIGQSTPDFAARILGQAERISGYVYQTVPVALHAWLRYPGDFRAAIENVIACGGDTDTTAAITGGIVGAGVADTGIPSEWLDDLREWPCSVDWMRQLAARLAASASSGRAEPPLPAPLPARVVRNLLFLGVVLYHGFRRLLPPY